MLFIHVKISLKHGAKEGCKAKDGIVLTKTWHGYFTSKHTHRSIQSIISSRTRTFLIGAGSTGTPHPVNHAKALAIVISYDIYLECAEGELDPELKVEHVVDYDEFRDILYLPDSRVQPRTYRGICCHDEIRPARCKK